MGLVMFFFSCFDFLEPRPMPCRVSHVISLGQQETHRSRTFLIDLKKTHVPHR